MYKKYIINYKILIVPIVFLAMIASGCKTETPKSSSTPVTAVDTKPTATALKFDLPPLPIEVYTRLFEEATYVDYIFYDLPFSVSQSEKPSIQANVLMIDQSEIKIMAPECKPIGREFFHFDGEIEWEADLYFTKDCLGYVFLKDQKPIYANAISAKGGEFYSNLINQASKIQKRGFNGQ